MDYENLNKGNELIRNIQDIKTVIRRIEDALHDSRDLYEECEYLKNKSPLSLCINNDNYFRYKGIELFFSKEEIQSKLKDKLKATKKELKQLEEEFKEL